MNLKLSENDKKLIILSELGALIHDLGKLSNFFIAKQSKNGKYNDYHHGNILEYDSNNGKYPPNDAELEKFASNLKRILESDPYKIKFLNEECNLHQFLKEHHLKDEKVTKIIKLLHTCDAFDAQEDRHGAIDKQPPGSTYYSNAFGYERELTLTQKEYEKERKRIYEFLVDVLRNNDLKDLVDNREKLFKLLEDSLSETLGMTARSANDVSLWEHSYMSASIMKALLLEYLNSNNLILTREDIEKNDPFKILSVTWDFFAFISQSYKIPDVNGRIIILEEIKNKIKKEIEIELMLGNCIYEDDNGLHFLIPVSFTEIDFIKENINNIFNEKVEGIINPFISLSKEGSSLVELLPEAIKNEENKSITFIPKWISNWEGNNSHKFVCNVCSKGYYIKDKDEEICDICNKIRNLGRKADDNHADDNQTIFLDEIAWNNNYYGNICLFILNFNLNNWLNGDNIQNLFIKKPIDIEKLSINKRAFKKIILSEIGSLISEKETLSKENIKNILKNFENELNKFDIIGNEKLISNEIIKNIKYMSSDEIHQEIDVILQNILEKYEIIKISNRFNKNNKAYLKTPSPSRLMRVWNNTNDFFDCLNTTISKSAPEIRRNILKVDNVINLKNPPKEKYPYELKIKSDSGEIDAEGYFQNNKLHIVTPHANKFIEKDKSLQIEIIDEIWELDEKKFTATLYKSQEYKAFRTISISPQMFMFIAPSHKTEEILTMVKNEYSKTFGKVYGKLPLNISLIYFNRKMPMYTVFDSAKRFLDHKFDEEETISIQKVIKINEKEILFETSIGKILIPASLGDGAPDYYHPYLYVKDGENCININNSKLKHAQSLKEGEKIKIHPSLFDFIFLDSNIRRFAIFYKNSKRPHSLFNSGPRPYFLEEIDTFKEIWSILKDRCDNTQLNNFESLLISKIKEWNLRTIQDLNNKEFIELVKSSIVNILKIKDKDDDKCDNNMIYDSVMSGMFFDIKELYHTILKEKLGGNIHE